MPTQRNHYIYNFFVLRWKQRFSDFCYISFCVNLFLLFLNASQIEMKSGVSYAKNERNIK